MSRRASSGIQIGQVIGIGVALLGFVAAAALIFRLVLGGWTSPGGNTGKRSARDAAMINLATYRDNANSLRGNLYRIDGKVEEMLRWTPDRGRLISLEAAEGGDVVSVPVLVPKSFDQVNLERGSDLHLVVRVDRDGTLVTEGIDP